MTDNVKESAAASKVNLLDFDLEGLTAWCAGIGEKAFRATQLSRWLHRHVEGDFDNMTNLAKVFRAKLKDMAEVRPPVPITEKKSADGTRKWLFDVGNGNAVESVFIPEDDRGTLCISTQAGCAMGCLFCSTGKQGFNRNLTTAEIVGQLWWAERELRRDAGVTDPNDRIISNVVLMGMGEPLQNLDNVLRALHVFLDDNGYGLSRRRVTVSTSGLVRQMDKLAEDSPVALAVSLHAGNDALRDKLMPVNRKHPLADLMAACRRYLKVAPRDFITFEYVMLGGINDRLEQADELVELVRRENVPCKFNLIPFNPFTQSDLRKPEREQVLAFCRRLNEAEDALGARPEPELPPKTRDAVAGDTVELVKMGTQASVIAVNKDGTLQLQAGILKITAKQEEVRVVEGTASAAKKTAKVYAQRAEHKLRSLGASPEVDLRGMMTDEALAALDLFLDNALMAHLEQVTVIHGKGTGAVRKAVREHLKRSRYVKSFRPGHYGEGEDGVTIVELK